MLQPLFALYKRLFLTLILTIALSDTAVAARKALVLGSSNYSTMENLPNAVRDARDLTARLQELGFKTTLVTDSNRRKMHQAITRFADGLSSDDTALFFFAGHGIHDRGKNYLVPVDSQAVDIGDVEADAIDAGAIMQRITEAGPKLSIMLLDACRNNPLKQRSRGVARGLGLIQLPGGARGTLIGYAAGIGEAALDSIKMGKNGLYTGALLQALAEPGLTLEQVMKRVRADVSRLSQGRQNPWTMASIQGDFIPNETVQAKPADIPRAHQTDTRARPLPTDTLPKDRSLETFMHDLLHSN